VNLDAETMKQLAGFVEHFGTDVEGVMRTAVLLYGSNQGFFALAENDIGGRRA